MEPSCHIPVGWRYFAERGELQVYVKGGSYRIYSSDGRLIMEKGTEEMVRI